MPAFPPATAVVAADALAQQADEALNPGPLSGNTYTNAILTIVQGGVSMDYGASGGVSVIIGELRWAVRGGGSVRVQELFVTIRKTVLTSPPAKDARLIFNSVEFLTPKVDGLNTTDTAWSITAERFPK